jgi:hypothetical protein
MKNIYKILRINKVNFLKFKNFAIKSKLKLIYNTFDFLRINYLKKNLKKRYLLLS